MSIKSSLLFCGAVIGFGSAFSLTNVAVSSIAPLWVAAGRSLVALLVLGIFVVFRRRPITISAAHIPTYISVGILTGVIPYTMISWGQQFIPSSLGGVLFASTPLLTLLFGFTLFKLHRPRRTVLAGAVIGLVGVALAFSSSTEFSLHATQGAIATIIAAASYAVGGLLLQRQITADMVVLSTVQLIPATLVLTGVAMIFGGPPLFYDVTGLAFGALITLGVFGTSIPLVCLFALVQLEGAKRASLTTFFIPFVAVAIGGAFLREPLPNTLFMGLIITLAGAYWAAKESNVV